MEWGKEAEKTVRHGWTSNTPCKGSAGRGRFSGFVFFLWARNPVEVALRPVDRPLSIRDWHILLREISRGEGPVASVAQSGTPPCCSGSENERWQRSGSSSGARGRRALNRILRLVSPKMFPEGGLPLITERIQRWQGGQKSKVRIFFFFLIECCQRESRQLLGE